MENIEIYREIARSLDAWKRCVKNKNTEWEERHEKRINELIQGLPHGSGLDGKWELEFNQSSDSKLIFRMSFHTMNNNGMYDRWIDFTLIVKPSLAFDVDLKITGNFGKYQDIKEYLYEILG